MYYYLLSEGEYEDYFCLWFAHPEKLSEDEAIAKILAKYQEAKADVENLEGQMWDECEQLFGTREYPNFGLPGIKGTRKDLKIWDEKWKEVFPICREVVFAARLAGFELLQATATHHFKCGIEAFFEQGGEDKPLPDNEDD